MTTPAYPRLFAPLKLGGVTLQNRLVMLPHGTSMLRDGAILDDDIAYYRARARSGPGMMITGAAVVAPESTRRPRILVENYSDHVLDGLARRAEVIRSHGVVAVGQIIHLGRESIGMESDHALVAPSALRSPRDPFPPHVLTEPEIADIVRAFGHSAANLKKTGHDGVEIHGAHGYLVAQFLSPATNLRDDAYGGDLERRFRFLREVIAEIRARCGDDFLLGLRLSADEEIADGLEIGDTVRIANQVEREGGVDYLSITLGTRGAYVKDVTQPEATAARAAGIIRNACGIPVLVGQRITRPDRAEQILSEGQADMIGMARAFIADPDWVAKAADGRAGQIRPCIGVNQDCRAFAPHLHCAVNPQAGRENIAPFSAKERAPHSRKVAIIGAGPAGLELARTATLRGHDVTLFEASDGVGGQFLYASSVPHRQGLRALIDFYQKELRRLGVPIEFGAMIEGPGDLPAPYDAIIVATGAKAKPVPEEFAGPTVRSWFDILSDGAPATSGNGRALMVDDGSGFWWNYGVAELLSEAGWQVVFVSPSAAIGKNIPTESLPPLLARLGRGGTEFRLLTQLFSVDGELAELINLSSGAVEDMTCGLVVMQTGRAPTGPLEAFRSAGMLVHSVGDCVAPRRMSHAVFEAQRLALSL
jgi:2,4-dienoyl-CoA reductase (NADPH2)